MSNTAVLIKRSTTTASPLSLKSGELAYSYVSNTLFIGTSDGTSILQLGGQSYMNQVNAASSYANSAYLSQNTTGVYANTALQYANSAGSYANSAYLSQNTTGVYANTALQYANSAGSYANTGLQYANSAGSYANSAYNYANTSVTFISGVDAWQNTAISSAGGYANGAYLQANAAYTSQNTTGVYANTAFQYANSAGSYANSAYANANTKVSKSGDTMTGTLYINTSTGLSVNTTGGIVVGGDVVISGNLSYSGYANTYNSFSLNVQDPLIYMASNNSSDAVDIGFVGHFVGTGNTSFSHYQHTGLVRDYNDRKWKLFSNVVTEPTSTVLFDANTSYDTLKVGVIEAGAANVNNYDLFSYITGAYLQANSAYVSQNTTGVYANTALQYANSAGSYSNSAYIQANAAYNSQNTTGVYANAAFSAQNTTGIYANSAYSAQNTTGVYANTAFQYANSAGSYANSAYIQANSAYVSQNTTGVYANTALQYANSAGSYANSAFTKANNSIQSVSGTAGRIVATTTGNTVAIDLSTVTTTVTGGLAAGNTITSLTIDSWGRTTAYTGSLISILGNQVISPVAQANNIYGGAANQIPYQTGSGVTSFIAAPGVSDITYSQQLLTVSSTTGQPAWTTTLDGGSF